MYAIIFLAFGGLTALGFLRVVWRKREMPALLRAILILAAVTILAFVIWILVVTLGGGSG